MTALRQVRVDFGATTMVVYQAYSAVIADAAMAAGTFVAPFSVTSLTAKIAVRPVVRTGPSIDSDHVPVITERWWARNTTEIP